MLWNLMALWVTYSLWFYKLDIRNVWVLFKNRIYLQNIKHFQRFCDTNARTLPRRQYCVAT